MKNLKILLSLLAVAPLLGSDIPGDDAPAKNKKEFVNTNTKVGHSKANKVIFKTTAR